MQIQKVLHLHLEENKKNPKLQGDYICTIKKDGWYVYIDYFGHGQWDVLRSGAGRIIPSMINISSKYISEQIPDPKYPTRFIFEAYIPDTPFHILNGIFNRSVGECEATDVHFYLHDMVYLQDHYNIKITDNTAGYRFAKVCDLINGNNFRRIQQIPLLGVSSDRNQWYRWFDEVTEKGEEGIVLKRANGLYSPGKRNSDLMKIKLECEKDLLCKEIFWTVGEKGNDNMNLRLERKNGTEVVVRVGKHEDIAEFTFKPENVIGKVVQVKAMKELENGQLREPRFVCCRYDKNPSEID